MGLRFARALDCGQMLPLGKSLVFEAITCARMVASTPLKFTLVLWRFPESEYSLPRPEISRIDYGASPNWLKNAIAFKKWSKRCRG